MADPTQAHADGPVRRIHGLETEFGVACSGHGARRLTADEVARYLFRKVVTWGRSSNVFLRNGSRIYLDVGSHPEYATAECDDLVDLISHDRAGERIFEELSLDAEARLAAEGIGADIYLFKNNTDSHGNSYGCHENYSIGRVGDFSHYTDVLVPFLVSRQLICGAGKIMHTPAGPRRGARYVFSQRAEHIWESVSSATTRSRPIINTRDEPHADPERFRRLHVIVGDSNMSETTTLVKVASTSMVLRLIELGLSRGDGRGIAIRNLALDNPIRAIRDLSTDPTGQALVTLSSGRTISGLALQREYLSAVTAALPASELSGGQKRALDLWERALDAIEADDPGRIDTEIDWAIKRKVLTRYAERNSLTLEDPRLAQLDLAYHDIRRSRGIFGMLERRGQVARVSTDPEVFRAKEVPPQTTRAKLRGAFITAAQRTHSDYTVDWVHLKLNDQSQRTVLCRDPFVAEDERVDRLIASMSRAG